MKENSWRNFQSGYILGEKKQSLFFKTKKLIMWVMAILIFIGGIYLLKINVPEKKDVPEKKGAPRKTLKNRFNYQKIN